MLPPIDASVLQNNPEFAALYKTLTTTFLNPDGSTKDGPGHESRCAVREELKRRRLGAARHHLLSTALTALVPSQPRRNASSSNDGRAGDDNDLFLLLPLVLSPAHSGSSHIAPSTLATLLSSPPLSTIQSRVPSQLALPLSSHLQTSAISLARLLNPDTNPSFLHRAVPQIALQVRALAAAPRERASRLLAARERATNDAVRLGSLYARALASLVRALETKHGVAARSAEMRAAETALVAREDRARAAAVAGLARREAYGSETTVRALARYSEHLHVEEGRLREGIRRSERRLEAYGVAMGDATHGETVTGREKVLREIARVFVEMSREVKEVSADLERLGTV